MWDGNWRPLFVFQKRERERGLRWKERRGCFASSINHSLPPWKRKRDAWIYYLIYTSMLWQYVISKRKVPLWNPRNFKDGLWRRFAVQQVIFRSSCMPFIQIGAKHIHSRGVRRQSMPKNKAVLGLFCVRCTHKRIWLMTLCWTFDGIFFSSERGRERVRKG